MKISQILNEALSTDTALARLPVIARELNNVVLVFAHDINEAVEWNDPGALLPAVGKIANWVHTNYKSSKRVDSNQNIESLMQELSKNPKFKEIAERCLSSLKFNMERDKKQSALQQFDTILGCIKSIMDKAGIKHAIDSTIGTYRDTWADYRKLRAVKMSDRGIDVARTPVRPAATKDIAPSQRAQVETVVNHILSTLSSQHAAAIRAAISKSDNKLAALKKEMDALGL